MNPSSPPDSPAAAAGRIEAAPRTLLHAMLRGGLGFAAVSVAGFSVWAFAGKWLSAHFGEAGLYATCLLVLLAASGLLLHPLVRGPRSLPRFYRIFIPAFFAYAIVWCVVWFALRFGRGEWLGSLLGSLAFVAMTGWGFGNYRGFVKAGLVLFTLHSAGYFLGGQLMHLLTGPAGVATFTGFTTSQLAVMAKLAWGLLYGLGFGAGMGCVFCMQQRAGGGRRAV